MSPGGNQMAEGGSDLPELSTVCTADWEGREACVCVCVCVCVCERVGSFLSA